MYGPPKNVGCDPSVYLYVPSIVFVYVYGSQVFALFILFLCVILHTRTTNKGPNNGLDHTLGYHMNES